MKTKLQEIRKLRGYKSARIAAEAIGIPHPTYTNYEQGVSVMSVKVAWKLADFFDVTIDELVGRKELRTHVERIEYAVVDASLNEQGNERLKEFAEFLKTNPENTRKGEAGVA